MNRGVVWTVLDVGAGGLSQVMRQSAFEDLPLSITGWQSADGQERRSPEPGTGPSLQVNWP